MKLNSSFKKSICVIYVKSNCNKVLSVFLYVNRSNPV